MNTSITTPPFRLPTIKRDSERILSIDALRGFNLFWILGADEWVRVLAKVLPNPLTVFWASQMSHVQWEGLHFYDLIFAMFVFISGVSVPFSLTKILQQQGRSAAIWRVVRRSVLLFMLGILYYGGFSNVLSEIRIMGVLQRIAIGYLFASLVFIFCRLRWQITICAALLLGYWALMVWVPIPGSGTGGYTPVNNLANYIDWKYLPLYKWNGTWDPEGLFGTITTIASCMLGMFIGVLIKNENIAAQKKVFWMIGSGIAGALLGYWWSNWLPIIKNIWTSSFVLITTGYSMVLLALFYQIIDIWKKRTWATPFLWIGSNAIVLYMLFKWAGVDQLSGFFSFHKLANRLAGQGLQQLLGIEAYGELILATVVVGLVLCLAYLLHKNKIFIRL